MSTKYKDTKSVPPEKESNVDYEKVLNEIASFFEDIAETTDSMEAV